MPVIALGPRVLQCERDFVSETCSGAVRHAGDHSRQKGDEGPDGGRNEKISRLEEKRLGSIRIENEGKGEGNKNVVLGLCLLQKPERQTRQARKEIVHVCILWYEIEPCGVVF